MKKRPCAAMRLTMYDHSNDTRGKGMKSREWLSAQIDRRMRKDRGTENHQAQKSDIN